MKKLTSIILSLVILFCVLQPCNVCAENKELELNVEITSYLPVTADVTLVGNDEGVVVATLVKNDTVCQAITKKAEENLQFVFDSALTGDKVKVMWLEDLKSLKPLCEAKTVELPYVSNKKIMTVVKKAETVDGYVITGYTEGKRVEITVDAAKEPIVEKIFAGKIIAYVPDGETIKDIEIVFSTPLKQPNFTPEKGESFIAEDTKETVVFGLAEYSTDSVTVNGVKYTANDNTNYFLMKYITGGANKLGQGIGKYDEMKDNYVLIRVINDKPNVLSDVIIFENINVETEDEIYVSNKKIMTVEKVAEYVEGYKIAGYSEGKKVNYSVDINRDPIVEEIMPGNVIAYELDGDVENAIWDIEPVFLSTKDSTLPEEGQSLIPEGDTLETVAFGLVDFSTDCVTINDVTYTADDDTNYLIIKYAGEKLYFGTGKYSDMKRRYVLIRVKADAPTVISDVVIFEGIN